MFPRQYGWVHMLIFDASPRLAFLSLRLPINTAEFGQK